MLKSGEVSHCNEMNESGRGDESRGGEVCAKISRLDKACWRFELGGGEGREGKARRGEEGQKRKGEAAARLFSPT